MEGTLVQATRIPLWDGPPPYALGDRPEDQPFLDVYLPDPQVNTGAAMLLLPGGCYTFLSDKSGARYAEWLTANGVAGIVVNFRLGSHGYRHPAVLADARQACALVHRSADEWGIDPTRVGVIGTSAGGHLAAMLITGAAFDDDPASAPTLRPAVAVLCYAVVSMLDPLAHRETRGNFLGAEADDKALQERFSGHLRVTADTGPCFIWHTLTDDQVPAEHSMLMASALGAHGIPYELHLYGQGEHALGLAREEGLYWPEDCLRWLRTQGMLAGKGPGR
jgi:acetyl esterase/lipase